MYIIGQTGEIIINTDHVECIYEQLEDGVPAIKAKTCNVNATLGLYKSKDAIDRAMAQLGLALLADDANRMRAFAMPPDPPEPLPAANNIHQLTDPVPGETEEENGKMESNVTTAGRP